MWSKKRYLDELHNAEQKDEREAKKMRGGQLIPSAQYLRLVREGLNPIPTDHNPEAEILYINAFTSGASFVNSNPETSFITASFDRNYDKILIQRPCDYHLATVRIQFPLTSVPLFLYPIGSCQVTVGFISAVAGTVPSMSPTASWYFNQQPVLPISVDAGSDLTAGQNPNYPNGAIAIFNVQQMLDAVESAIYTAGIFVDNLANLSSSTYFPSRGLYPPINYDETSQIFNVAFEQQAWYGGPDLIHYPPPLGTTLQQWPLFYPLGTAFLFFNNNLFQRFFNQIPMEFTTSWQFNSQYQTSVGGAFTQGLPAGTDVCIRLNAYYELPTLPCGGPQLTLVNPSDPPFTPTTKAYMRYDSTTHKVYWNNPPLPHGVRQGDIVVVSGVQTQPAFNRVYRIFAIGVSDPGGGTDLPSKNGVPTAFVWEAVNVNLGGSDLTTNHNDVMATMCATFGSQLLGQLSSINTQAPEMGGWCNGEITVRLKTYNIPIREEFAPAETNNFSSSGITTRQTLLDLTPLERTTQNGKLVARAAQGYFSQDIYRWTEMISETPLYRWSAYAVWVDQFGTEYPIYLAPGEIFEYKAVLRRKDVKF